MQCIYSMPTACMLRTGYVQRIESTTCSSQIVLNLYAVCRRPACYVQSARTLRDFSGFKRFCRLHERAIASKASRSNRLWSCRARPPAFEAVADPLADGWRSRRRPRGQRGGPGDQASSRFAKSPIIREQCPIPAGEGHQNRCGQIRGRPPCTLPLFATPIGLAFGRAAAPLPSGFR